MNRRQFLTRTSAATLLTLLPEFPSPAAAGRRRGYPTFDSLASGPQQVRLLPNQTDCVFTMYSIPADLNGLKQLVAVMRKGYLGNGFDPGPAPRPSSKPIFDYLATVGWPVMCYPGCADMQIKGGGCVLGKEDEAAIAAMDQAGVFTAVQLGEWGYYFHNLSHNEGWWRDVYGADYEKFKNL